VKRVVVIGHGAIGKIRAKALFERGAAHGATLVATVDPRPRDPVLYGGAQHHASLDEIAPEAFDAAVLALPHDLAHPVAMRLIGQKKVLMVEKPLGLTGKESDAIVTAASAAKLQGFVGYNYRFLPAFKLALAAVRRGELGRLRSIDMILGHGGHPKSDEEWKLDPKRAGGGVILDPGVHLFDLMACIEPELEPVFARGTRGFWKTGIEEDVVCVFATGACIATVRVSHIRWVNTFRVEIVGDDGYAILEGRGGTYGGQTLRTGKRWGWNDGSKRTQKETEVVHEFGVANASFEEELDAVLDAWSGNADAATSVTPATFEEAAKVAHLCDSLYGMLT
jgi:1,5-anhydro-D-fructose reductase (1,5-anhydro-D-mannitol-forming)